MMIDCDIAFSIVALVAARRAPTGGVRIMLTDEVTAVVVFKNGPRIEFDLRAGRRAEAFRDLVELTIDDALRSKAERRICGHARWSRGCDSCRDWAVANGVAFAREMAAPSETPE